LLWWIGLGELSFGAAGITTTEEELQMKSYLIAIFVSFFTLMTLSGCETMEGFGRDVEKVGSEIEDEADK
jgi:predicted small secreted protein